MAERVDANTILNLLVAGGGSFSVDEISNACRCSPYHQPYPPKPTRKAVINRLGCLMKHKLVERARDVEKKQVRFGDISPQGFYRATPAGRDFVKAGKRVQCGRQGPLSGSVKPRAGTLQQRLWNAMRIKGKFSIPDLLEAARRAEDMKKATDLARHFLHALRRAGIVSELGVRAKGHALTSNGFKRFILVKDLGPLMPACRRSGLFDHNTREIIPYAEAKR